MPLPETAGRKTIHVLTLTPFYPTRDDDASGCFVAEPLPFMEREAIRHTVIATRSMYQANGSNGSSALPAQWTRYPGLPGSLGLSSAGFFLSRSLLPSIRTKHEKDRFDIIHAHAALPCGQAAMMLGKALQIPFVVTVHGLDAYFENQVKGLSGKWCRSVCQKVYQSARGVICISQKVREKVSEQLPNLLATRVIQNGVDEQRFAPAALETSSSRILAVGNLIPIKGHDALLRAFAVNLKKHPGALLDLIGEGSEMRKLKHLASELKLDGSVRFLGRQSRSTVATAMRECDIFALPSRYEGLGCVYLEAMACAKPVIACRGQGIEDVIQHPVNGLLVDPDNIVELSANLEQLMNRPSMRQTVGNRARQTIIANFTFAKQARRMRELFEECLQ